MDLRAQIRAWLAEDLGPGPFHFEAARDPWCEAHVKAKSAALLCGAPYVLAILEETQSLLALGPAKPPEAGWEYEEGARVPAGAVVCRARGHAQTLLKAERTLLNFLSHLSEIATHTANVLKEIGDLPAGFGGVIDTRKNTPGLRHFEKYAVRTGGARNHRLGFFDGDLIKDNDIAVAGGVRPAIDRVWGLRYMTEIQIEVQDLAQLDEVLSDGRVHMILLDNMDLATLREAVSRARQKGTASRTGKPYSLEASGVGGAGFRALAEAGVDFISTSRLVRAAPPLDFNMKIVKVG
ncbi:MAG: carboxylating nicotinate-nucleotide diphosphorylase [Candidatus Tectomicrobia bacterium]|uniref:nicotinate-nucleotide diphosphorylase (carboxylating) n=1 Tax=Tectimicrobiota bacterium TaxID=2528274 RepID=A0A932MNJ4_UNCTE|nr:carboxylating nicotinate-nucleotide diphosphorylase [Candidatus Tectomicrobia bacterium]